MNEDIFDSWCEILFGNAPTSEADYLQDMFRTIQQRVARQKYLNSFEQPTTALQGQFAFNPAQNYDVIDAFEIPASKCCSRRCAMCLSP
jgi:hypothetical protein